MQLPMRKQIYRIVFCSVVVFASFLFRIPAESRAEELTGGNTVAVYSRCGSQPENCLKDAGNMRFSQAFLPEEKQTVFPQVRRLAFRFLPLRNVAQQNMAEQRVPVSKPKFLAPPSQRLIVGRYIRANPSICEMQSASAC